MVGTPGTEERLACEIEDRLREYGRGSTSTPFNIISIDSALRYLLVASCSFSAPSFSRLGGSRLLLGRSLWFLLSSSCFFCDVVLLIGLI
jgi:hypothetical protein